MLQAGTAVRVGLKCTVVYRNKAVLKAGNIPHASMFSVCLNRPPLLIGTVLGAII